MRSFMLRHKGAEFRLYGGEAVPAPLKGDRLKGRHPEARGFSRVRLHNIARYLVKNETVFLFNEHGVHSSYTMTITLTPWTIEDIEKMDGIEITDYIK